MTKAPFDPRLTWAWTYYTAAALLALAAQPLVSSAAWGVAFNVTERVMGLVAVMAWLAFAVRGLWASSGRVLRILDGAALPVLVVLLISLVGQFLTGMVRPGVPMLLIASLLCLLGHRSLGALQQLDGSGQPSRAAAMAAGFIVVTVTASALLSSLTLTHHSAKADFLALPQEVDTKGWQLSLDQTYAVLPAANGVVAVRTDGLTAIGADGTTLWEYRRRNATVEQWAASHDRRTTAFIWGVGRSQLVVVDNLTGAVLFERTLRLGTAATPNLLLSSTVVAVVTPTSAIGYRVPTGAKVWTEEPAAGCSLQPTTSASTLSGVLIVTSCTETGSPARSDVSLRDDSPTIYWTTELDPSYRAVQVSDDGRLVAVPAPDSSKPSVYDTAAKTTTSASGRWGPHLSLESRSRMVTPDGTPLGSVSDDPRCRPDTGMTQIVTEGALGCLVNDRGEAFGTVVVVEYNRGVTEFTYEKIKTLADPDLFVTGGAWVVVQHMETGDQVSITGLVG